MIRSAGVLDTQLRLGPRELRNFSCVLMLAYECLKIYKLASYKIISIFIIKIYSLSFYGFHTLFIIVILVLFLKHVIFLLGYI